MKQIALICNSEELAPVLVGNEKCVPLHTFGPAEREYYLIHFVLSGKGVFTDLHGVHEVREGDLFLIKPREITVYTANREEPWAYTWIGFVGERAKVFENAPSVIKAPNGMGERLLELVSDGVTAPEIYLSLLYELTYRLFREGRGGNTSADHLRRIQLYIDYNYMQKLSVDALAREFGFERSYLFRIFRERYGVGVKQYITEVRMKNAVRFLSDGHSVAEVAAMVGYNDPFNFSTAFKKRFGKPPSKY